MRRRPARCRAADSEYKDGARRCRSWQGQRARAGPHRHGGHTSPDRAGRRSRTPRTERTPRSSERYTADKAPGASRTGRSRRTPATQRTPKTPADCRGAPSSATHESVRRVNLLRDILEGGMANILAVHHIDHIFADVFRMIAYALQCTHDPHDLECAADRTRILHHEGDALALNRLVFLVHHFVLLGGLERRLRVHAGEGIERIVHHLRDLPPQVLYFAVLIRGPLHGGQP